MTKPASCGFCRIGAAQVEALGRALPFTMNETNFDHEYLQFALCNVELDTPFHYYSSRALAGRWFAAAARCAPPDGLGRRCRSIKSR